MNSIQRRWLCGPALLLAAALLSSCATSSPTTEARPRFRETAAADVVLRHYKWEHINLTKPNYREGGYLVQLSRDTLSPTFERLRVQRNLAVVVFGWYYSEPELRKLVAEWNTLLASQGFTRIVSVRATGRGDDVDGALVIDDTSPSNASPKQAAGL